MTKTERRIDFFRRYCLFYLLASMEGIVLLPYSFHRTEDEQLKLFKSGKSNMDGRERRSYHQDWLAMDAVIHNIGGTLEWDGANERYKRLAEIAEFVGLETGYNWGRMDSNHTQVKEDE